MRYTNLPDVGAYTLPTLAWRRSPNQSGRAAGHRPHLVFVHVWGDPQGSFEGVVNYLRSPGSQASAHVVYAGEHGRHAGAAAQLVPWGRKAWTESAFNSLGLSIESADAIWLGHDPDGFARLARMVAGLCHLHGIRAQYVRGGDLLHGTGFTRHADAGLAGGGHTSCPTRDLELWRQFAARVVAEARHGGFRSSWGRS